MLVTLEGTFATNAQEVHAQIQVVNSFFFFQYFPFAWKVNSNCLL